MSGKLLVHTPGHWVATREQVGAVPLPEKTDSYMPVGHLDLLDTIRRAAGAFGWSVRDEKLALAREGQQLFAVMDFDTPGLNHKDIGLAIGARNAYDKSMTVGILGGGNVTVCSNLLFTGEWGKEHKHTPGVWSQLYSFLFGELGKVSMQHEQLQAVTAEWRKLDLDTKDSDHMLVECVRRGVLPASELPKVLREYSAPSVEAWEAEPHNVWRLFNAYTQVCKGFSPALQIERVRQAHNTFAELVA